MYLCPLKCLVWKAGTDMRGLALLVVRGQENLPNGLTALPLASAIASVRKEWTSWSSDFREAQGRWAVAKGNISSRQGRDLYFSPAVDEGYSGGPIIQSGKVIGMVLGTSQPDAGSRPGVSKTILKGLGSLPKKVPL